MMLLTLHALLSASLLWQPTAAALPTSDVAIHVAENASAGHVVADLRTLLQLPPEATLRIEGDAAAFRIDDTDRLVVASEVPFDFETRRRLRLVIRIDVPQQPDPLRQRFASLVNESPAGLDATRHAGTSHVMLHVGIDDCPEAPRLLNNTFHVAWSEGKAVDRVVAIDPDTNEQLRYELLEGSWYFRIDPVTGELFLREDAVPLSISSLPVRVRVTDAAHLQDVASYQVGLVRDWQRATIDTPSIPRATHTTSDNATPDDMLGTSVTAAAAGTAEQPPVTTMAPRGGRAMASAQRLTDSWTVGLVIGVLTACILVIFVSGAREIRQAARTTVEDAPPVAQQEPAADQPVVGQSPALAAETTPDEPSEISDILSRLDLVLNKSERPHDPLPTVETVPSHPFESTQSADDIMTQALMTAGLPGDADRTTTTPTGTASPTALMTPPALVPVAETETTSEPAAMVDHPLRLQTDLVPQLERDGIAEFRQISRISNRADIGRHQRLRLRQEWLSVGLSVAACVATGSVCLFTSWFDEITVSLGPVLCSIAAVLLMRPSLYPQTPRRRATDLPESGRHTAKR